MRALARRGRRRSRGRTPRAAAARRRRRTSAGGRARSRPAARSPSAPANVPGVDAVGGQADALGHARRSRSGSRARGPRASPCSTGAAHLVRAAEDLRPRPRRRPRASSVADARRRVRQRRVGRGRAVGGRDEPEAEHLEAELGAHALQQRHVAVTAVPEVEVGTDDDEPRAQHAREHLARRTPRRSPCCAPRRTCSTTHSSTASGRVEQLELLFERRQQARRRLRAARPRPGAGRT